VHFPYKVTIPKNTTQSAPYEKILRLGPGIITAIRFFFPAGHAGTAHCILLYHEYQAWPSSRGEDYHGDQNEVPIMERFDMESGPYEVKFRGWNTDTANDHAVQVHVEVLKAEQLGLNTGAVTLTGLQQMIGSDVEV
jgi:hypothetical protein